MTWFKVDDSFHSHPKVLAAEPAALGLWVVAGSWCGANLTDGFVPDYALTRLLPGSERLAEQLVTLRLWRRAKGGYRFHDWSTYQPTKEEATAAKEKKSSGGALGNHRRWHAGMGRQDANCPYCQGGQASDIRSGNRSDRDRMSDAYPNPPDPTRPDPTNNPQPSVVGPRKRGTRIPDDFQVTEEMAAWGREHAPNVNGPLETVKFKNYWMAKTGKDATKLDWERTWQNWILRAAERQPNPRSRQQPKGYVEVNGVLLKEENAANLARRDHFRRLDAERANQQPAIEGAA